MKLLLLNFIKLVLVFSMFLTLCYSMNQEQQQQQEILIDQIKLTPTYSKFKVFGSSCNGGYATIDHCNTCGSSSEKIHSLGGLEYQLTSYSKANCISTINILKFTCNTNHSPISVGKYTIFCY